MIRSDVTISRKKFLQIIEHDTFQEEFNRAKNTNEANDINLYLNDETGTEQGYGLLIDY